MNEYRGFTASDILKTVETGKHRREGDYAKMAEHLAKMLKCEMTRKGVTKLIRTDKQLITVKYLGWRVLRFVYSGRSSEIREKHLEQVLKILMNAGFEVRYDYTDNIFYYYITVDGTIPRKDNGKMLWYIG